MFFNPVCVCERETERCCGFLLRLSSNVTLCLWIWWLLHTQEVILKYFNSLKLQSVYKSFRFIKTNITSSYHYFTMPDSVIVGRQCWHPLPPTLAKATIRLCHFLKSDDAGWGRQDEVQTWATSNQCWHKRACQRYCVYLRLVRVII